uniref:RanBP2-type domain-containing protein n=1 Tax=Ciona savignyi TaxID=51511 RepID=H2Z0B2_CIOSA
KSSDPIGIPKVAGTWTCPDCYASNGAKHLACPCCGAADPNKPNVAPDTKKESAPKYKFGAPSGTINTSSSTTFKFGQQMDTTKRSTSSCLESILLGQNTFTTTTASIGSAGPQKAAESWNCPDCYVTNPCGVSQCPCCNAYNPNVPA